jgi:DNA topoisomerase-1
MDYNFTANVENDFDKIAKGELVWNDVIAQFYAPFHKNVEEVMHDGNYSHVTRELGTDGDGNKIVAKFGKYGPYIQKGEGEKAAFASLGKGQLIETITLEEALKLFLLPRTVGQYKGIDVIATKGRFGPYIKYGDKNFSLPRGTDPLSITMEKCGEIIEDGLNKTPANSTITEYKDADIQVIAGRYGPYIKHAGGNYKIPKGTDASKLTLEECQDIINNSEPSKTRNKFHKKS